MTNFQPDRRRPIAAWLTPERAVVVVPILGGLALAATLASVVITPQMVHLRERRELVEVLEQKRAALPSLAQSLGQRRFDQAEAMAQQQRLLALIALVLVTGLFCIVFWLLKAIRSGTTRSEERRAERA